MAMLQIDGIGDVEIDDAFLKLSPQQQAAEVDAIATQIRGGGNAAPAAAASAAQPGFQTEEQAFLQSLEASQPKPDTLEKRGSILPAGRDKEGNLVAALPSFLEGPRQTIMDLIEGRRNSSQITG